MSALYILPMNVQDICQMGTISSKFHSGILSPIGISKEHNLYIPLPSRLMALYISLGKLICIGHCMIMCFASSYAAKSHKVHDFSYYEDLTSLLSSSFRRLA